MEFVLFVVVCFLVYVAVDRRKQSLYFKSEEACADRLLIDRFHKRLGILLASNDVYITIRDTHFFHEHYEFYKRLKRNKYLSKIDVYTNFFKTYEHFFAAIKQKNERFISEEMLTHGTLLDNIDGKALDAQQRRAVIVDDMNNLVLAGAGSGKTLTIAAKTKYLVDTKHIKPQDILLISFTKKSSDEMQMRISEKLDVAVQVKTFHKLGLDLIVEKYNKRPDVQSNLGSIIDDYFKTTIYKDKKYMFMIVEFFAYYLQIPKDVNDFESLEAYNEYKMSMDYETLLSKASLNGYIAGTKKEMKTDKETLQKERVKSYEELIIANFLFLNGISYEYERLYPYDSEDPTKKRYRPDFYLKDYDIYLEHFGINEDGECPQYSPIEAAKYKHAMTWKRELHAEKSTVLLETYSYMTPNGQLIKHLEKILKEHGVRFVAVDRKAVFQSVFDYKENRYLNEFKKLISTFVHLFKSKGYNSKNFMTVDKQADAEKKNFLKIRSKLFFRIVRPIYEFYQDHLNANGIIDFNDMINMAIGVVESNEVSLPYKYIIIDEYQDISYSRYKLIKAIKDKTDAKLLCVGDDWQSIYRFAGSDISLFADFESYFGEYELNKIEKTYRNSQELIDIAGKFVMKNKQQLHKSLKSDKTLNTPIEIIGYTNSKVKSLVHTIHKIISTFGDQTDILLIGRNNFDINFLAQSDDFKIRPSSDGVFVIYNKYPSLKMSFMSAHKSKGIEATNVIIINGDNDKLGFPNKISDDPVLSYVLTKLDTFDYAEERRLFYVALTRTKNKTFILTQYTNESVFIKELMNKQNIQMDKSQLEETKYKQLPCPKCLVGTLIERRANQSKKTFVGCSNYPNCDYTVHTTSILSDKQPCSCGGYMLKRAGKYGAFYGCSNWPICKNKKKINNS